MRTWLLDINLLEPILWPSHEFYPQASAWALQHFHEPWATCPLTEAGFLRLVTTPSFSPYAVSFDSALAMLAERKRDSPHHQFWPVDIPSESLTARFGPLITHPNQITDAYLLTLAVQNSGALVTFDRRMMRLAPEGTPERDALVILTP